MASIAPTTTPPQKMPPGTNNKKNNQPRKPNAKKTSLQNQRPATTQTPFTVTDGPQTKPSFRAFGLFDPANGKAPQPAVNFGDMVPEASVTDNGPVTEAGTQTSSSPAKEVSKSGWGFLKDIKTALDKKESVPPEPEPEPEAEPDHWNIERILYYNNRKAEIKLPYVRTAEAYKSLFRICSTTPAYVSLTQEDFTPTMVVHYNPEDSQEESVLRDYLAKGPNPRTAIGALKNPYKESKIKGIPSIFYAVYSRNPVKVEKWLKEGADPNAVAKLEDPFLLGDDNQYPFEVEIPVLIFAILLGEPKIVSILLSFNSNPVSVPKEMRLPFVEPEIFKSKTEEELKDTFITKVLENPELKWCNDVMFEQLRRTLNLSMRYYLHRGDSFKVTQRYRQMAKSPAFDFQPLFRAQFDLIGQEHALKGIFMKMLLVSEKQSAGRANKPVVLMFAGPSGHGKTEMARQMGHYLGLPFHTENMAQFQRESELFGTYSGYSGYGTGSTLNNYLSRNNGKRCIVFLDEIEKTSREVLNALLLPFERDAELTDRRTNGKIDISKVIWIMATNSLDSEIKRFYENHKPITSKVMLEQGTKFIAQLRKMLHLRLSAAFTSRLDLVLPFFPFSPEEQAVLAHRELWELKKTLKLPISLAPESRRLVGNIDLALELEDFKVCRVIAKLGYIPEEGARSIKRRAEEVECQVFDWVLAVEEEITEEDASKITEYIVTGDEVDELVHVHRADEYAKEKVAEREECVTPDTDDGYEQSEYRDYSDCSDRPAISFAEFSNRQNCC